MLTQMLADMKVSRLAYGCMLIGGSWNKSPLTPEVTNAAFASLDTAMAEGINFFDHADIYTCGKSEQVFGQWLAARKSVRGGIFIQSKCGIRGGGFPTATATDRYDFSYDWIVSSTESILQRLGVEYIDSLLLHRPDALVEPAEVARAFDHLATSGKVRHFGVSNHTAAQIELLKKSVRQPLIANQVEINILHTGLLDAGINWNIDGRSKDVCGDGTLEYCRTRDIVLQAWSPMANGLLSGRAPRKEDPRLARIEAAAKVVADIATEQSVTPDAIVVAWLLRHPASIQPVIGTRTPDRIKAACQACKVSLSREDWYRLYVAGRGQGMP